MRVAGLAPPTATRVPGRSFCRESVATVSLRGTWLRVEDKKRRRPAPNDAGRLAIPHADRRPGCRRPRARPRLAFRELEALTSSRLTRQLTFLLPRVARQQARLLQDRAVLRG